MAENALKKSEKMAAIAWKALDEKQAQDIRVIDIHNISVMADYFVIATGDNRSQIRAMVENVEEKLEKAGYTERQKEGYTSGNWVLLDFSDIIIHVFDSENRLFYDLERIWSDGKEIGEEELEAIRSGENEE